MLSPFFTRTPHPLLTSEHLEETLDDRLQWESEDTWVIFAAAGDRRR